MDDKDPSWNAPRLHHSLYLALKLVTVHGPFRHLLRDHDSSAGKRCRGYIRYRKMPASSTLQAGNLLKTGPRKAV
jgi:hypothetical protein